MTLASSVVLIPIKNFLDAKTRLRHRLASNELEQLARELASGVIAAWAPRRCVVLCDDDDVAMFARSHGADVLTVPAGGLNIAVHDGYQRLGIGYEQVIISHADLATPSGLGTVEFPAGLTIVTDRHGLGTNVMALPARLDFEFAYGTDSAERHRAEGERCGLSISIITDSPWGFDIDDPEDLDLGKN